MKKNIVILDGQLANPGDLTWKPIETQGHLTVYPHTTPDQIISRSHLAEVVITNKVSLNRDHFSQLPHLRLICLLATGYDNVNIRDVNEFGITVCNAVNYSTHSVAQHVFAMLLMATNRVADHHHSVQRGEWSKKSWSYSLNTLIGLQGKTLGIYGFGQIGRKVASIGQSFGMNILVHNRSKLKEQPSGIRIVDKNELYQQSDVLSLHVPLNNTSAGIINRSTLTLMKPKAILINTGRGGLIVEQDLRQHLLTNTEFIALLDVLSEEPPPEDHPLIGLNNCFITPHNAWSNLDARKSLINIVSKNIEGYYSGHPKNVVSL